MMRSQPNKTYKKCFYYFKYEMKIEFIPHIEEEIQEFLKLCQQKILAPEFTSSILSAIQRRIKDIDSFFNKNWNDYRVQQILRSKKLLLGFTKKYHQYLSTEKEEEIKPTKTLLNVHSQVKPFLKSDSKVNNSSKDLKKYQQSSVTKVNNQVLNDSPIEKPPSRQVIKTPNTNKGVNKISSGKVFADGSKEKVRVSVSSEHKKLKVKSTKIMPKISPTTKKMTKEQYIIYLKNKKANA